MAIRDLLTPERVRFVRFCVVGGSGVFVNLAFVWLGELMSSGLSEVARSVLPSVLGIVVSVFTNFLLNSAWTWGDRTRAPGALGLLNRVARYYMASGAAIGIQFVTAQALSLGLGFNLYLGQSAGILLDTAINFLANNRWTFGSSTDTQEGQSVEG